MFFPFEKYRVAEDHGLGDDQGEDAMELKRNPQ